VLGHVIPGIEQIYDRHEYFREKAIALEKLAALIEDIVHGKPRRRVVRFPQAAAQPLKRKPALTELGKAIRERDALRTRALGSLTTARQSRLHLPVTRAGCSTFCAGTSDPSRQTRLTDDDLDQLADLIEALAKRKRGRERNRAVHEAARLADVIMHMGKPAKKLKACGPIPTGSGCRMMKRESAIAIACREIERSMESVSTESRCAIY